MSGWCCDAVLLWAVASCGIPSMIDGAGGGGGGGSVSGGIGDSNNAN